MGREALNLPACGQLFVTFLHRMDERQGQQLAVHFRHKLIDIH
jgi:hypothetical protein